jgi:multiple sugar transport system substrate-binding protein
MRRLILLALALAIGLTASPIWSKPKVTLTYWCSPYPNEAGWAITVTRLWNQQNPNVHVKLQAIPQGRVAEDVIRDAIRAKKTPDVCSHLFPADVNEFVAMGGLLSVDAFPKLVAASQKRSGREVLNGFRSPDGRLYQVPWKCNPIMLQYNKGMLAKYGVRPPRTYSEFLSAADTLRRKAGIYAWAPNPNGEKWWRRYYDFYPLYFAAANGRAFLDARGQPAFNNMASVAVLDFVGQSFRRGYAPPNELYQNDNALNEAFAAGKLGFLVTGPWNIPQIEELAGNTVKFDFVPMPVPDVTPRGTPTFTYGNFRNVGIFANSAHRAEAARFVEFLISKQSDRVFLEMCSELPYRQDLLTDPAFASLRQNRYLTIFARQLANVRPVANSPHFNQVLGALSTQFEESAVRGTKPAKRAIQDAVQEARRLNNGR